MLVRSYTSKSLTRALVVLYIELPSLNSGPIPATKALASRPIPAFNPGTFSGSSDIEREDKNCNVPYKTNVLNLKNVIFFQIPCSMLGIDYYILFFAIVIISLWNAWLNCRATSQAKIWRFSEFLALEHREIRKKMVKWPNKGRIQYKLVGWDKEQKAMRDSSHSLT